MLVKIDEVIMRLVNIRTKRVEERVRFLNDHENRFLMYEAVNTFTDIVTNHPFDDDFLWIKHTIFSDKDEEMEIFLHKDFEISRKK